MTLNTKLILIIDDDENFLKAISIMLKTEGYGVISANNGFSGIQAAKDNSPDLIICDLMMPTPNGFEVLKLLKKRTETASMPIIFLTARVANADKLAALSLGAADYITKPFDKSDFLSRIEKFFSDVRIKTTNQGTGTNITLKSEDLFNVVVKALPATHFKYREHILTMLEYSMKNRFADLVEEEWFIRNALTDQNFLYGLINDMLVLINIDLGRVGSTRPVIDIVNDVHEPIHKHVLSYRNKHIAYNFIVQPNIQPRVPKFEFTRSLIHMVDNACKYCPENGEIFIILNAAGKDGCVLTVIDQGVGIPFENHNLVFERNYFFQTGQKVNISLGIGLFIVRSVAQQLGGYAQVLDSPDYCAVQMFIPPSTPSN